MFKKMFVNIAKGFRAFNYVIDTEFSFPVYQSRDKN